MIVNDRVNQVEVSGAVDSVTSAIAVTGKSFRVISDGLYKNKIETIVRELCSNAYDSHILAISQGLIPEGTAFDVHFPSKLAPYFEVRDYGVGMNKEFMLTTFTKYFQSTKTATNDQIGAMGLGSKSPLAYAESFTITSWTDGHERVYSMFWNESDLPEISLLGEAPSDQPSGVKVMVQVKSQDFIAFARAVKALIWFEEVKPNIICDDPLMKEEIVTRAQKPKFKMSGTGWMILDIDPSTRRRAERDEYDQMMMAMHRGANNALRGWAPFEFRMPMDLGRGASAKHGPVIYPIDREALSSLDHNEQMVLRIENLVLDFPIGSLDVIASREGLSYKEKTIQALRKAVAQFLLDVSKNLNDMLAAAPNFWEAAKIASSPKFNEISDFIAHIADVNLKYRDRDLLEIIGSKRGDRVTGERIKGFEGRILIDHWAFGRNDKGQRHPFCKASMALISNGKGLKERITLAMNVETIRSAKVSIHPQDISAIYVSNGSLEHENKIFGDLYKRKIASSTQNLSSIDLNLDQFLVVTGSDDVLSQVREMLDGAPFVDAAELPAFDVRAAEDELYQKRHAHRLGDQNRDDPLKLLERREKNGIELPLLDVKFAQASAVRAPCPLANIKSVRNAYNGNLGSGGTYLHFNGKVAKHRGQEISVDRLKVALGLAMHSGGHQFHTIFLLDDEQVKLVEKHAKWRNVLDIIADKGASIAAKFGDDYDHAVYRYLTQSSRALPLYDSSVGGVKKFNELADDSPFRLATELYEKIYRKPQFSESDFLMRAAARALTTDDVYPFASTIKTNDEMKAMYPLLKHLKMNTKTVNDILDYVKMIDTQNGFVRAQPVTIEKPRKVAKKVKKA